MKKYIVATILAAAFLAACTKEEPATTSTDVTQAAATPTEAPAATATPTIFIVPEEPDPDENPDDVEVKESKGEVAHNDFFSANLAEFVPAETEEDMTRLVFEFTNITDKTYYKNDEEIVAGGTWEKTIMYHGDKWTDMAGHDCLIHYDLYEDYENQKQIYKGGLHFAVNDDLQIDDIYTFED